MTEESKKIIDKFPTCRPVIVDKYQGSTLPELEKKKYIVPCDITLGQFMYIIRKKIKMRPEKAIFLFIENKLVNNSTTIGEIYESLASEDGLLYMKYSEESVFGGV